MGARTSLPAAATVPRTPLGYAAVKTALGTAPGWGSGATASLLGVGVLPGAGAGALADSAELALRIGTADAFALCGDLWAMAQDGVTAVARGVALPDGAGYYLPRAGLAPPLATNDNATVDAIAAARGVSTVVPTGLLLTGGTLTVTLTGTPSAGAYAPETIPAGTPVHSLTFSGAPGAATVLVPANALRPGYFYRAALSLSGARAAWTWRAGVARWALPSVLTSGAASSPARLYDPAESVGSVSAASARAQLLYTHARPAPASLTVTPRTGRVSLDRVLLSTASQPTTGGADAGALDSTPASDVLLAATVLATLPLPASVASMLVSVASGALPLSSATLAIAAGTGGAGVTDCAAALSAAPSASTPAWARSFFALATTLGVSPLPACAATVLRGVGPLGLSAVAVGGSSALVTADSGAFSYSFRVDASAATAAAGYWPGGVAPASDGTLSRVATLANVPSFPYGADLSSASTSTDAVALFPAPTSPRVDGRLVLVAVAADSWGSFSMGLTDVTVTALIPAGTSNAGVVSIVGQVITAANRTVSAGGVSGAALLQTTLSVTDVIVASSAALGSTATSAANAVTSLVDADSSPAAIAAAVAASTIASASAASALTTKNSVVETLATAVSQIATSAGLPAAASAALSSVLSGAGGETAAAIALSPAALDALAPISESTASLTLSAIASLAATPADLTPQSLVGSAAAVAVMLGMVTSGSGASSFSAALAPDITVNAINALGAIVTGAALGRSDTSSVTSGGGDTAPPSGLGVGSVSAATLNASSAVRYDLAVEATTRAIVTNALGSLATAALQGVPVGAAPITLSSVSGLEAAAAIYNPANPPATTPNYCGPALSMVVSRLPTGVDGAWNMSVPKLFPCTPVPASGAAGVIQLPASLVASQPPPTVGVSPALLSELLTGPLSAAAISGATIDVTMVQWGVSPMPENAGLGNALYDTPLAPGAAEAAARGSGSASSSGRRLGARISDAYVSLVRVLAGSASANAGAGVATASAASSTLSRPAKTRDRLPNRPIDSRPVTVTVKAGGVPVALGGLNASFLVTIPLRDLSIVKWDSGAGAATGVSVGTDSFFSPSINVTCPASPAAAMAAIAARYTGAAASLAADALKPARVWLVNMSGIKFSADTYTSSRPFFADSGPAAAAGGDGAVNAITAGGVSALSNVAYTLATDCGPDFGVRSFVCGPGVSSVVFACPAVVPVPTCLWFDEKTNAWAGDGCRVAEVGPTAVTCACSHLTDFAVRYASLTQQPVDVFGADVSVTNIDVAALPGAFLGLLLGFVSVVLVGALLLTVLDARTGVSDAYRAALRSDPEVVAMAKFWAARGKPWAADDAGAYSDVPSRAWRASAKVSPAGEVVAYAGGGGKGGGSHSVTDELLANAFADWFSSTAGVGVTRATTVVQSGSAGGTGSGSGGGDASRLGGVAVLAARLPLAKFLGPEAALLIAIALSRAMRAWEPVAALSNATLPARSSRGTRCVALGLGASAHAFSLAFIYAYAFARPGVISLPALTAIQIVWVVAGGLILAVPLRALMFWLLRRAAAAEHAAAFGDYSREVMRREFLARALASTRSDRLRAALSPAAASAGGLQGGSGGGGGAGEVGSVKTTTGGGVVITPAAPGEAAAEAAAAAGWRDAPPCAARGIAAAVLSCVRRAPGQRAEWVLSRSSGAAGRSASVAPLYGEPISTAVDGVLLRDDVGGVGGSLHASQRALLARFHLCSTATSAGVFVAAASAEMFCIYYALFFSFRFGEQASRSLVFAWFFAELASALVLNPAASVAATFWTAYGYPFAAALGSAVVPRTGDATAVGDAALAPLSAPAARLRNGVEITAAAAALGEPGSTALLAHAPLDFVVALALLAVGGRAREMTHAQRALRVALEIAVYTKRLVGDALDFSTEEKAGRSASGASRSRVVSFSGVLNKSLRDVGRGGGDDGDDVPPAQMEDGPLPPAPPPHAEPRPLALTDSHGRGNGLADALEYAVANLPPRPAYAPRGNIPPAARKLPMLIAPPPRGTVPPRIVGIPAPSGNLSGPRFPASVGLNLAGGPPASPSRVGQPLARAGALALAARAAVVAGPRPGGARPQAAPRGGGGDAGQAVPPPPRASLPTVRPQFLGGGAGAMPLPGLGARAVFIARGPPAPRGPAGSAMPTAKQNSNAM